MLLVLGLYYWQRLVIIRVLLFSTYYYQLYANHFCSLEFLRVVVQILRRLLESIS